MKNTIFLLISLLIISCSQKKAKNEQLDQRTEITENQSPMGDFDWILGEWKRLNEEEGKETFENWVQVNDTVYAGIGFTMQLGDTISQEKMKFIRIEQQWMLMVHTLEEHIPTTFTEVSVKEEEFVFENQEIDFPNTIRYWKSGERMNAVISNDEFEIEFEFVRKF